MGRMPHRVVFDVRQRKPLPTPKIDGAGQKQRCMQRRTRRKHLRLRLCHEVHNFSDIARDSVKRSVHVAVI